MNRDIVRERKKGAFNPLDLTYVLDNGKIMTEKRRRIESMVYNDPQFKKKELSFMNQVERFNHSLDQELKAVRKMREQGWNPVDNRDEMAWFRSAVHGPEVNPLNLHTSMFLHTIMFQMTEEQQKKWLQAVLDFKIFGTYAQTELGHGTFLRGLETTATYDPSTQEFVLHSPTLTSMKWWPGNLGKVVTHAIVAARLITRAKDHGIHMFLCQLRHLEDHTPMPGVELGDIGPKFGFNNLDNGFLRLDHVRIPREQMCMRFSQVKPDGIYIAPPNTKLSYSSMVLARSNIVYSVGTALAKGATIATRYSAVRRQSELIPGRPEPLIIEYQSQQLKLFPQIATAIAFILCGQQVKQMYLTFISQAKEGNYSSLPELHSTTAGLKAFATQRACEGLEVLRMACGGHGYSSASAFPEIYGTFSPTCTFEGENTVMLLQTARFLVKAVRQASKGGKLTTLMSYLKMDQSERCNAKEPKDFMNIQTLLKAYRHRAKRMVTYATSSLEADLRGGLNNAIAWNKNHLHLLPASTAHCHLFVLDTFNQAVENAVCEDATKRILRTLVQFYALDGIVENKGEFLESGYLSIRHVDLVSKQLINLLAVIRPNAVSLVDAFDIHDDKLGSVLGRYDGNVYENLYKWAKSAPLNEKDVPDAYHLYIKPFLEENKTRVQARL
ncbi:Peroxisomal acyl-coenzyme A oxidase 1 [Holothuria leucospilota]|uniref:Acyl-coenzyme A oxidase n=1 Tax=Holothuria leucospilota TaxID=206669 RepID=A0A9Q1BD90_HOLLE|nr:Peroxisomal acyl-coenzyme A oxidase 1 [Holothuria leucospilota]